MAPTAFPPLPPLPLAARAAPPFRQASHRAVPPPRPLPAGVPALILGVTVSLIGAPRGAASGVGGGGSQKTRAEA